MTFLNSERRHRLCVVLATALLLLALAALFCLCVSAEKTCTCDAGTENGFCTVEDCNGYEIPALNKGADEQDPADDFYEIANAGQLYYFKNEILQKKDAATAVQAKLVAHIVVNPDLLNDAGEVSEQHLDGEGELKQSVYHWEILNATVVSNVVFDGDGYTISGLYGVRTDALPAGFFGKAENVTLKNLGLLDCIFSSTAYTGALVGEGINRCSVVRCFVLDSAVDGAQSAGLVGKLGYVDAASYLDRCYTDAGSAIFECAAENTVTKCYYLAESEADSFDGTTHLTALADEGDTLLNALSTAETRWHKSCLRGVPMLREEHKYENPCDADCMVCDHARADGEEGKAPHEFDNKCDAVCNVCGNTRTLERTDHYYRTTCDTACRECGFTRTAPENHKFSNKCDEYCNNCQFKRVPPITGHEYSNACDKYCNQCSYERVPEAHVYDDKCDMVCNVCATTRPGDHTYDNSCDTDCNDCGRERTVTHTFGEYTVISPATHFREGVQERTCSVCGQKERTVIEELPGWPLWLILLASIGGGVLLLVGGFCVFWFVIKKRSFAQLIGRSPEQLKAKEKARRKKEKKEKASEDAEN